MTSTYLPIAVGLMFGVGLSAVLIMRSRPSSEQEVRQRALIVARHRRAIRAGLVAYAVIAWTFLVVSAVLGNVAYIVLHGIIALIAAVGLVRLWSVGVVEDMEHP